jgi:aspartate/methionine/tyrosine aminotransferase
VYRNYDYSGRCTSAATRDSPDVAVTDSFAKSMAITGFRVGSLVLPPVSPESDRTFTFHDDVRTRHMLTTVTGSRPAQYAVQRAMETTGPDYYEHNRKRLRERIDTFCAALEKTGATVDRPEGGFYVMARFDDVPGTFDAVYDLIDEAGVAAMPGEAFGESRDEWLRFALCTDRVEEAADRLVSHLD